MNWLKQHLPTVRMVATIVITAAITIFGWGVAWGGSSRAAEQARQKAVAASEAVKDLRGRVTEVEAWRREHGVAQAALEDALRELKDAVEKVSDKVDGLTQAVGRLEGRLGD